MVVRREVYAKLGGFRKDLKCTLDVEMWTRIIGKCGGVVLPDVMAFYRISSENEGHRLGRYAETLVDITRLSKIFAERYPDFDLEHATRVVWKKALDNAKAFAEIGDKEAAQANLRYWRINAPIKRRLRRLISNTIRKLFG